MQGKRVLGLAVMLCLWLVGSVGGVQGPTQTLLRRRSWSAFPALCRCQTSACVSARRELAQGSTVGNRRGRLAPGYAADLVVFDPDTIADTATFEAPHSYPTGVTHVAVNGVLVVENGAFTGRTPGKVIRDFSD